MPTAAPTRRRTADGGASSRDRQPQRRTSAPRRSTPLTLVDPRRRGMFLLIVTGVALSLFAGRLVELQAVQGKALAAQAVEQRLRTQALPAPRGAILDSAGQPLALTVDARNIVADQTKITNPSEVAATLGPVLGADPQLLADRLTGTKRFMYVAKGITPQLWSQIAELRLPGITSESYAQRVYPAGDVAANVVGFTGDSGTGLGGVEYAFQSSLAGTAGERSYERGPGGHVIPTGANATTAAQPGATVKLTLDRDIQFFAQRALAEQVANAHADSGTIVVMDPRTGDILALGMVPTFDPNHPSTAQQSALGNRALNNVFEPGSTSKLMTMAAVINEGAATPYSAFTVKDSIKRGDKLFHDHDPHPVQHLTLAGIMAESSNVGTIQAAERIGGRRLYSYLKKFGIGEATGLHFPAESPGFVPPYSTWSPTSFPTIAFGQGLSVNAVQSASVYATIANNGVRVQPRLVDQIINPDGSVITPPVATPTQVVTPQTAQQVRSMLESVVGSGGTGTMAAIPGYRVGGKTGTAQEYREDCHCYKGVVASFIGMAPLDNPQLVVAVSIFNPRVGHFGGELGGPVFKRVMTYALQARKIPPTGTPSAKLALTYKA